MQKKKTSQPVKPTETFPSVDDFFTQFLDKKKRNYTKKLEKIEQLQKKTAEELTSEQRDLINNRQKVLDDAAYYDEIKQLYFQAHNKKETNKAAPATASLTHTTTTASPLGLFYLAKSVKEQSESALRVLSSQGVEFQEKLHNYNRRIFAQEAGSDEGLKDAEAGLQAYAQDSEFSSEVSKIWSEGQMKERKAEPAPVAREPVKEAASKPQLFAMSSDEEEEEQEERPAQVKQQTNVNNGKDEEFRPNFVPLPEDDNEDAFAFESGNKVRGDRRGRKPRGDRPYRKYDNDRNDNREDRRGREERAENGENQDNEGAGEERENKEGREYGERRGGYRGNRENREGGYRGNKEGGYRGNREDREGGYRGNREDREGGYRGNRYNREGEDNREGGYKGNRYNREGEDNREGGYRGNREEREGGYKGNREDREGGYKGNREDREGGYKRNREDNREGGYKGNRYNREGEDNREGRDAERPQRARNFDGEREGGERGRGYGGRGRGDRTYNGPRNDRNYNGPRGDNNYAKREVNVEKKAE